MRIKPAVVGIRKKARNPVSEIHRPVEHRYLQILDFIDDTIVVANCFHKKHPYNNCFKIF